MWAHRITATALTAPAVAVVLLAGCSTTQPGGTTATQDATAPPAASSAASSPSDEEAEAPLPADVCSLVSLAEATEAVGSAITTTDRASTACTYSGPSTGFDVSMISSGWEVALIGLKTQTGSTPAIPGVGDRAAGADGLLVVQSGPRVFSVQDVFKDQDPDLSKAIAVARVVISHL